MNRVALFISFLIAALGVVLLVLYVREFEKSESGGEKVRVMVAKTNIDRGAAITDDNIDSKEIPLSYVEDRAIKYGERSKVLGLRLGAGIQTGQTLMWTDLTTSNEERRDLSSLITPGRRGVGIRTAKDDHGVQLVRPGDYVDVIVVVQKTGEKCRAAILLQRVLVLAKGLETNPDTVVVGESRTRTEKDALLTLSLLPHETQLLQIASDQGRLTVALRNPDDPRTESYPDLGCERLFEQGPARFVPRAGAPETVPGRPVEIPADPPTGRRR